MKSRHLDKHMSEAIAGVAYGSNQPSLAARLDRRDAEGVPLRAYVSYFTDERMGLLAAKAGLLICRRQDAEFWGRYSWWGPA